MSLLKKSVAALALVGVLASPAVVSAQDNNASPFGSLTWAQISVATGALIIVGLIVADDDSDSK